MTLLSSVMCSLVSLINLLLIEVSSKRHISCKKIKVNRNLCRMTISRKTYWWKFVTIEKFLIIRKSFHNHEQISNVFGFQNGWLVPQNAHVSRPYDHSRVSKHQNIPYAKYCFDWQNITKKANEPFWQNHVEWDFILFHMLSNFWNFRSA